MMGWYGDGPGWAGWVVMTLMMLVFWGLLDERFALGEIDEDDYTKRRELLRSGR